MNSDPLATQLFGKPKDNKKKPQKKINHYESFADPWKDLGNNLQKNVSENAKKSVTDAWKQLLGSDKLFHNAPKGGQLEPGKEVDLKAQNEQRKAEAKPNNITPGINYAGEILRSNEKANQKEREETQREIQDLIAEIRNISGGIGELGQSANEAIGSNIVSPNKYHKTFLKWVISILRDARAKIENAGTWLQTMQGKKNMKGKIGTPVKQKAKYQQLAKKEGTKFTQSSERSTATSGG